MGDLSTLDFDLTTPSAATVSMKAVGNNPVFGAYKIIRDASLKSAGQVITLSWTRDASFQQGPLAPRSPIVTDFHMDFDATSKDLTGKNVKNLQWKGIFSYLSQRRWSGCPTKIQLSRMKKRNIIVMTVSFVMHIIFERTIKTLSSKK